MKRILTALVFVSGLCLAEDANPAKDLFNEMEAKLAAAKSLRIVVKASEPREKGDRHDVTVRVSGAKARFDFDWWGETRGEKKWTAVTDGASVWSTLKPGKAMKAGKSPAKAIAVGFARAGTFGVSEAETAVVIEVDPGDGTGWKVAGFKLGKKETKDGVELQAVEYSTWQGKADPIGMVVWIDVKTKLPKRRDVNVSGWKLVESYECEIDPKIEDSVFVKPE